MAMIKGKIEVKGMCYEDLVTLLTTNGYDVKVEAKCTTNATQNTYVVKYKKHDFTKDCIMAC